MVSKKKKILIGVYFLAVSVLSHLCGLFYINLNHVCNKFIHCRNKTYALQSRNVMWPNSDIFNTQIFSFVAELATPSARFEHKRS